MEYYANYSGNSGVETYETGTNFIIVGFNSGSFYEYTYASAGAGNVETMKSLAVSGSGLCSFIQRNVKRGYSRKW